MVKQRLDHFDTRPGAFRMCRGLTYGACSPVARISTRRSGCRQAMSSVRFLALPCDGVVQFRPFLGNRGEREPTVGVGGQGMS